MIPEVNAQNRSWKSWFIEQYFWLKGDKSYYSAQDPASFDKYVQSAGLESNKGFALSADSVNGELVTEQQFGMQVHRWNKSGKANQRVILYLHGGSYLNNPTSYHIDTLKTLSTSLDAEIVLPIYPKAPSFTYQDSIPKLIELYKGIRQKTDPKNITIMGDSAGGGLALALALAVKDNGLTQPKDIILLSPWLDVSMSNPGIPAFEESDPILSAWGLRRVGEIWAGGAEHINHPYVSPINGDFTNLAPITLFVGTREIFYPDIIIFREKLASMNHPHQLFEGTGMNHVYPIYPISEAKDAQYKIIDTINKVWQ
ncbi:alpha/beta hydrolase [Streptococcus catagoni]|uniref:alpha/beta hydrolase n=1 Tax=Streptococcus catagoni TaxID=2654874 RepID=UPI001407ED01|nr:alpha/beta hydrolase [Streptococcus catagoni]